jgi:response regulator RpfG family c-di-GMP phosphodiesterase
VPKLTKTQNRFCQATVLGLAVSGMHYMGMFATRFVSDTPFIPEKNIQSELTFVAVSVVLATVLLTIIVVVLNSMIRYRILLDEKSASESRIDAILSTAIDGIVTIDEKGIILSFNNAAEYKDTDTGEHIARMSQYSQILALAYGMSEQYAELILQAAPMHDIGKIGIPDAVLLKPGKLTDEEFEQMKTHSIIGAKILENSESPLLQLAHLLGMEHHEKWDGTGYPNNLKAEEISVEGRIVAIADVFDALTSKRPYKEAWPVEEAFDFIEKQAGIQFDPDLVRLFLANKDKILAIRNVNLD